MKVIFPPALGLDTIVYVSASPLASVALALPSIIPSLNVSVGLTVIGLVGARLGRASEVSRRAAASCTHDAGVSTGAAGVLPLMGLKIASSTLATTVKTL